MQVYGEANDMSRQPLTKQERKAPLALSIVGAIGMAAIILTMLHIGNHLETIEDRLSSQPLQTASYLVEKRDVEGGSGASFIVEWSAEAAVNPPIIEAVMVGVGKIHNLAFTSRGQPIARTAP